MQTSPPRSVVPAARVARSGAPSVSLACVTITFRLAGDATYTAVEDVSLAVGEGEFVAIVGPTGCGKSTLLNVAAGLLAPAAGRVEVFGAPLAGLNRDAGYLFQSDALFPWKTAIENVAIGLQIAGTPVMQARACATVCGDRVGVIASSTCWQWIDRTSSTGKCPSTGRM